MADLKVNEMTREQVLAAVQATSKGWQTRVNEVMREWVKGRGKAA